MTRATLDRIDAWAAEQSDEPARPEAVRRLVDRALPANAVTPWDALLERELEVGHQGADYAAAVEAIENHQKIAITITLRLLGHVRTTQLLLNDPATVIEARTLVRNCFECLFFLVWIVERGAKVVEEMTQAELGSRKSRAEFIFQRDIGDHDLRDRLREWVRQNAKGVPRHKNTPKDLVRGGQVEDAYLFYAQLSADAAHVTLDSLSRHLIERADGGFDFKADPEPREGEVEETKEYLSTAMCGAIVALNQVMGFPMPSGAIGAIWDQHVGLVKAKAASA